MTRGIPNKYKFQDKRKHQVKDKNDLWIIDKIKDIRECEI